MTLIQSNVRRYVELFSEAVDSLLPEQGREVLSEDADIYDVLHSHRLQHERAALVRQSVEGEGVGSAGPVSAEQIASTFPAQLRRRYEIRIHPISTTKPVTLRDVRSTDIGHLVRVKGIVTRASDVKPLLRVATYSCDECGFELYQVVQGRQFMPLSKCPSPVCTTNHSDGRLYMQTRACRFDKYQEIRIQELPEQVPVGHIPRTMTVVARGELARQVVPGDLIVIGGVYVPTPYTGFRAMTAGLIADTYFEAHTFEKLKKSFEDTEIDAAMQEQVQEAAVDPHIFGKLARSIAPEIYGHEDVKKALLLQLIGGVTRQQEDGMRIRGDLNLCLMGDPGVAKSQLLKHIATVAPRAVYTTGKGSSGVGLTAAVLKDPVTGELTLEGGALVLADMGICCIDEFDKMEDADRTAIHEVMEQQTVSIAKAGITTTLNARTSILAAANPLYGRFRRNLVRDPHQNLLKNVNLPAALLSRFDLLFLILDQPNTDNDLALARHVTYVHKNNVHPPLEFEALSPAFLRAYISQARAIPAYIPEALSSYIVESYVEMRARDLQASRRASENGRGMLTPRQLLSILRMSQALARLHFRLEVAREDVDEAIRLVKASKSSILSDPSGAEGGSGAAGGGGGVREDVRSRVFNLLRDMIKTSGATSLKMAEVQERVTHAGFSEADLEATLREYEGLNVLHMNASRTRVDFVLAK